MKKITVLAIILLVVGVGFLSGCTEQQNVDTEEYTDAKTVLVNGEQWTNTHLDYFGENMMTTYLFFEDGTYIKDVYESCQHRDSGRYYIKNDKLYLIEEDCQIRCDNDIMWEDTSICGGTRDWSLEIINTNTIKIGLHKFTN